MEKRASKQRQQHTPFLLQPSHSQPVSLSAITMAGRARPIAAIAADTQAQAKFEQDRAETGCVSSAHDHVAHSVTLHPEFQHPNALLAAAAAAGQSTVPLEQTSVMHCIVLAILRAFIKHLQDKRKEEAEAIRVASHAFL